VNFFKKIGGCCGCAYGIKGAVDRKSLGITGIDIKFVLERPSNFLRGS
jgi:hypothetical protein